MNRYKQIYIIFAFATLLVLCGGKVLAQNDTYKESTIKNYENSASGAKIVDGKQETHEIRKTIYVKRKSKVKLEIPHISTGANDDMKGYFRWFDYKTNKRSESITLLKNTTYNETKIYTYANGLVRINCPQKNDAIEIVNYQVPDSEEDSLGVIACDVSTYTDFKTVSDQITREPTLSIRYIFTIMNAKVIAEQIENATKGDGYYENYEIDMPSTAVTGRNTNIRLLYLPTNYYVYDKDGGLMQCDKFVWSCDDEKEITSSERFMEVKKPSYKNEKTIFVKFRLESGAYKNIAKYTIHFKENAEPVFEESLKQDSKYKTRRLQYLNENYILAVSEDFDPDDPVDLKQPTRDTNLRPTPLAWNQSSYGYVYESIYDHRYENRRTPVHSEYGLYKSANVDEISKGSSWQWYPNKANLSYYDRRYYDTKDTGKTEYGYFFYTDASDEAGTMAKLPLDQPLCENTKITVTAWICDISSGNERANVDFIFKGIDESGAEVVLHRFNSGYCQLASGNNTWQQICYTFSFKKEVSYTKFLLQIDNNCTNTFGADYSIDDIRLYMSKPTVQAQQSVLPCTSNSKEAVVEIKIEYDRLLRSLGLDETDIKNQESSKLFFKLLDKDKTPLDYYNYATESSTLADRYEYGTIDISPCFADMDKLEEGGDPSKLPKADRTDKLAWTEENGEFRYIVFQVANNKLLKYNYNYRVAIGSSKDAFSDFESICALVSKPFIIREPAQITVDGNALIDGAGFCYGSPITLTGVLYDRINGEQVEELECNFDWFFGDKTEEFGDNTKEINEALSRYRYADAYPSKKGDTEHGLQEVKGSFSEDDYGILSEAMRTRNLILNERVIERRVTKGEVIMARPIPASTGKEDYVVEICNDVIRLETDGRPAMPEIGIGKGEPTTNIRMTKAQLEELQESNGGKKLWIPVNEFKNSDGSKDYDIKQSTESENLNELKEGIVFLRKTDDPAYAEVDLSGMFPPQMARLQEINIKSDDENKYLVFTFNASTSYTKVEEGYTYRLMFFFSDNAKNEGAVCDGMSELDIKVVPEFLTWTGTEGDNWNNDDNWRRSTTEELYKSDANGETDPDNTRGFVPMTPTNVTIPATLVSPWLYQAQGGDKSIADNSNHASEGTNLPTPKLDNDLEVMTGEDVADKDNEEILRKYEFACTLFEGNHCAQIYFKPEAEVRNTHYLNYQKAWVDVELDNNRWYMLSSPLQGVVAGDMYLPTANGRQMTEAFKSITFNTDVNNRFHPAVYQRSWDNGSSVVLKKDDGTYAAFNAANWSAVYNKVDEMYVPGTGFSIRPIHTTTTTTTGKSVADEGKVLFRLPKDDKKYQYFSYDGTTSGHEATVDRSTTDAYRLINGWNGESGLSADLEHEVTVTNSTEDNGIFLFGNPYMATLDMKKFFKGNPQFENKYWILTSEGQAAAVFSDDGSITAVGEANATVAPMQGFFIKLKDTPTSSRNNKNANATFKPEDMTISKPANGGGLTRAALAEANNMLRITARQDGNQSSILIKQLLNADNGYNENEDVESLLDSNLKEIPTLYSVAENKAVVINTISDQKLIPLGIYSEKQEEVTLTFSGVETFGKEIELYDAELKTRTVLTENATVTVPGNTHGRYFISLERDMDGEQADGGITAYSPEANKIIVSASLSNKLKSIQVYNVSGMMVRSLTQLDSVTEELDLPGGMYIVRAQSQTENSTVKVIVKGK